MPRFAGFGPNAIGFFRGLSANNDRDWFQEHRETYESEIKAPMLALIEDLSDRFATAGLPLRGSARTIFRINRDVRFSKDKRPYQTHIGAVLTATGDKMADGLVYIHIAPPGEAAWSMSPPGSFVAVGFHQPQPGSLDRLRRAVAEDPDGYLAIENALAKAGMTVGDGEQLKRIPRGFEAYADSPAEAVIRRKSLIAEMPLPAAEVTKPKLADTVFKAAERGRPLLEFGWAALE